MDIETLAKKIDTLEDQNDFLISLANKMMTKIDDLSNDVSHYRSDTGSSIRNLEREVASVSSDVSSVKREIR